MSISLEPLRHGDGPTRHELGGMAFGATEALDEAFALPEEHTLAAYDGDELVASATSLPGGHWFGGRPVRGGAVAGVSVAPHRRGEGIAKPLMEEALRRAHGAGDTISALYPTTARLYRSVGYEMAGEHLERKIRMTDLRVEAFPDLTVTPFAVADIGCTDHVHAYDALAARSNGHVVRGDFWWWRRRSIAARQSARTYLLDATTDSGVGYVVLAAVETEEAVFDLRLLDAAASDTRTLRALASVLARFGTVSDTITTHLPAWVVHAWTQRPQAAIPTDGWGWMLRVINAPEAVAARGWPPMSATVDLELHDPTLADNTGPWRLVLDNGTARLEPGGSGTWTFDIATFSSWFAGWTTMSQLVMTGRVENGHDPAGMGVLDAIAAGAQAVVPEFY